MWVWAGTRKIHRKKYRGNTTHAILKIFISFPPKNFNLCQWIQHEGYKEIYLDKKCFFQNSHSL